MTASDLGLLARITSGTNFNTFGQLLSAGTGRFCQAHLVGQRMECCFGVNCNAAMPVDGAKHLALTGLV